MAQSAGHGPKIHPSREEFRRSVVAECVEVCVDAEPVDQALEPVTHGARIPRPRSVGRSGEDEAGPIERRADERQLILAVGPVVPDQLDGRGVDTTVTVIELATSEILATNTIDPTKTYWRNTQRAPGRWPEAPQ